MGRVYGLSRISRSRRARRRYRSCGTVSRELSVAPGAGRRPPPPARRVRRHPGVGRHGRRGDRSHGVDPGLRCWSLGNVLTRRRVVDDQTGGPLPIRRAIRRYFARRNVLRWLQDSRVAEFEQLTYRSIDNMNGPSAGSHALMVVPLGGLMGGAMYASMARCDLAAENWVPGDPNGPTVSNADRRAGSAVVKSRPTSPDALPTPATQSRHPVDAGTAPRTRHGNRPDSRPSPNPSRPTPLLARGSARTPGEPDRR